MKFGSIAGIVLPGKKLASTLGFPTLNLQPPALLEIASGVYACLVDIDRQTYQGIMNLGYSPTFQGKILRLEIHVFDFNQDCYGKKVIVTPKIFIRPEQKFSAIDQLKSQIKADIILAKSYFLEQ